METVVANTPRTLRATLPRIAKRILRCTSQGTILSSLKTTTDSSEDDKDEEDDDEERKLTGARAVSDLTRKLGERFIEGILPILRTVFEANEEEEEQIMASDKITKAGAAYALAESLIVRKSPRTKAASSARNKRRCLHLSSKFVFPTLTRASKTPVAWPSKL